MNRKEETTHPCYKPVRKTKKMVDRVGEIGV